MADPPSEVTDGDASAARVARSLATRRLPAAAAIGALITPAASDLWVAGAAWWDRHSFASCAVPSLLVPGVTVLANGTT